MKSDKSTTKRPMFKIIIYELTQLFQNNLIICWQEILE